MNLILGAVSFHLVLSRTNIIVYNLSISYFNHIKTKLVTYNKDIIIIRKLKRLTPITINSKYFLWAIVIISRPKDYKNSIRKRFVAFLTTFKIEKQL